MDKMTIGRMARLNHISEQTLRLYDRMGLLSPVRVGENGYRYYDMRQCAQLDMIQYMKSLGMSLKDIKMHMEDKNIDMMKSVLRQKSSQIERPECGELQGFGFFVGGCAVFGGAFYAVRNPCRKEFLR